MAHQVGREYKADRAGTCSGSAPPSRNSCTQKSEANKFTRAKASRLLVQKRLRQRQSVIWHFYEITRKDQRLDKSPYVHTCRMRHPKLHRLASLCATFTLSSPCYTPVLYVIQAAIMIWNTKTHLCGNGCCSGNMKFDRENCTKFGLAP